MVSKSSVLRQSVYMIVFLSIHASLAIAQNSVRLNIMWRVVVNGVDRMTVPDAMSRDSFPLEGQLFYIPKFSSGAGGSNVSPLYKLYIQDNHWKLIRCRGGKALLFDLKRDPEEMRDVASRQEEMTIALSKQLQEWRERTAAIHRRIKDSGSAPVIDDELREQLRALGYVE